MMTMTLVKRMMRMMKRQWGLDGCGGGGVNARHHHQIIIAAFEAIISAGAAATDGSDAAGFASTSFRPVFVLLVLQVLQITSAILQRDGQSAPNGNAMRGQLRADLKDLLEEHGLLMFGDVLQTGRRLPNVGVHRRFTDQRVEVQLRFRGFLSLPLFLQHIVDVVGTFGVAAEVGQRR